MDLVVHSSRAENLCLGTIVAQSQFDFINVSIIYSSAVAPSYEASGLSPLLYRDKEFVGNLIGQESPVTFIKRRFSGLASQTFDHKDAAGFKYSSQWIITFSEFA